MNLAICSILLKDFVKPFKDSLEQYFPSPEDKLAAVRNAASDAGNEEIEAILDYIEDNGLTETFFPK